MRLKFLSDLLTGVVGAGLDLKADDSHAVLGPLDLLLLDSDEPVVVESVLVPPVLFIFHDFAHRDSLVIQRVHRTGERVALEHCVWKSINVEAEFIHIANHIPEVVDLRGGQCARAWLSEVLVVSHFVLQGVFRIRAGQECYLR